MKVLIVDDRPENRLILETKMRAEGFVVASAANGVEALHALRREPYDLVVTDLMMPHMDGYQLTHAIKTSDRLKTIPVLVYTATYTDAKDEALARNLGADGFVVKPAADEEFFAAVREAVDRARRGELPVRAASREELVYLREYSERLISKLENKVAEHEAAEQRLRELNASLAQRIEEATRQVRQSNEDLEAFAYSVSHDLRAPLRGIEGYLEAVMNAGADMHDAERREFLERAQALAARGQHLISELLDYARLNAADVKLGPVSVAAAVDAALGLLEPAARDGAAIERGLLDFTVIAHERTLAQVLHNLIGNALKFAKPGERPRVTLSAQRVGPVVRIQVRDEGIGVPPDQQARIFLPFERLGTGTAGSGVALAIVERGVTRMGGRVGVESEPGEGSTFGIELPAA